MEFDEVVRRRHSVRRFKAKKASWKAALEAIDLAIKSPAAGNRNNVNYIVIEEEDKIKDIADVCEQDWIAEASYVVIACSDEGTLEELYGERGRIYSKQQAGAQIQTFLFKLTELGLASCWVGAFDDDKIRRICEIPKNIQIEAVLPVGFEYGHAESPRKRDLAACVFWESWGNRKRPTIFREPGMHDMPHLIGKKKY